MRDEAIEGWRRLVGNVEVLDIEGTHFDVFKADKVSNVRDWIFVGGRLTAGL